MSCLQGLTENKTYTKAFLSEEGITDEIRDRWSYNSVADPSPLPLKAKISYRQRRYFILREQYFICRKADFIATPTVLPMTLSTESFLQIKN